IDPACGSGHFLLYAFDVLERIWWAETDLDRGEIPAKILEHNLYGVDIDLRSCQLSAFNLYLKARTRAEAEGDDFEMPNLGIVCADARVAEVEQAADVLDQITGEGTDVREALDGIIEEFQTTEALGSLLDVQGTLSEEFETDQADVMADWESDAPLTLHAFLKELREAVEERTSDSFGEQNLRSFLNLLVVLTQDYDVALMNPPYGSGGRMPDDVQDYVEDNYEYTTEYYINFFEACDRLVRSGGRIGMLVPWSFMFNKSFQQFREDFVGGRGAFDFFSEFGYDVLDNATVGTVGTVVRSDTESGQRGTFIRLPDVEKAGKERTFLDAAFADAETDVQRLYHRDLSEFDMVPGTPLSYWVPTGLRELYRSGTVLDADNAGLEDRDTLGDIKQGIATADDSRFVHKFWENAGSADWAPFAKGGADAWLLPRVKNSLLWGDDGTEVSRYSKSYPRNTQYYFSESLTYTVAKRSGRRFGYLHDSSVFGHKGSVLVPDRAIWNALSYTNSHLFTYLMLTQTSERMWEVGFVSKVPWREELESIDELEALSREAVGHLVSKRQYDFVSPHYDGPILLDVLGIDDPLPQYDH
ncbi:BREX-5 system adenine-specific DNA-methyltransferase PglX, partial [Halorussus salinisoli]|uniref:BREX-5 system adenine-specific DNA-methyltransferase PglX n=1 Tax=Halorussus salinisoli TaxID=2558242 RepID=UPI0010C1D83E